MMTTLASLAITAILGQSPDATAPRELFADPTFERGFMLTAASHPVPKLEIGELRTTAGVDLVEAFGVASIPATYLIDPQGTIIRLDLRGGSLDEALGNLIKAGG